MENLEGGQFKANKEEAVEKGPKIKHREIAELREPIQRILVEMRELIDKGEYALIVGDDASGRVPVWVFYNFLKEVYKKKNLPVPKVRYFAGGYYGKVKKEAGKEIEPYLARVKEEMEKDNRSNQKALVVTDTISTGHALQPIVNALRKQDILFDVAAIAAPYNFRNLLKDVEVFRGSVSTSGVYGKHELAGVAKDAKHVFATFYKGKERSDPETQKTVNEAREDSRVLAHELAEWFTEEVSG